MINDPKYDIRFTHVFDAPYLRQWLDAEGMLHWFPMSEPKEVDDAIACWIGFSRFNCSLTALYDNVPIAMGTLFLMPYRKVAHHALFKLIVDPKYQRHGVGTSLIRNLKHMAKNSFRLDLIHTEIFEGNPLAHLLEKQGFELYARQEKLVKENNHYLARLLYETKL